MPTEYKFGKITVSCEGYDYPNDPYILAGSCGVIQFYIIVNNNCIFSYVMNWTIAQKELTNLHTTHCNPLQCLPGYYFIFFILNYILIQVHFGEYH
jgi:hypothetical protein